MQRALVIALENPLQDWEESLQELEQLADTAGAQVVDVILQKRDQPDPVYFVGKGKAEEIRNLADPDEIDLVIADADLAPLQQRNLENLVKVPVVDRTGLILDIFAQHAHSNEGQLQVELAQLNYMLPRLTGRGVLLSRLGGGIGTRGPGETKLEVDRRRIRRRISLLTKKVDAVKQHRALQRHSPSRKLLPSASLVGYTNAGKSTLLNALAGSQVEVRNKLFVTLDPTIRKVKLPDGPDLLMADTVGFIRNLPHQLVAAFRATFEEVVEADLLVHVVDASHPQMREQQEAVGRVLAEIGAAEKPTITVFNKCDQVANLESLRSYADRHHPSATISAQDGQGLDELKQILGRTLREQMVEVHLRLPYSRSDLLSRLHERGRVFQEDYQPEGVLVTAEAPADLAAQLRRFVTSEEVSEETE